MTVNRRIVFYGGCIFILMFTFFILLYVCCWKTIIKYYDCITLTHYIEATDYIDKYGRTVYILLPMQFCNNYANSRDCNIFLLRGVNPDELYMHYRIDVGYVDDFESDFVILSDANKLRTIRVFDIGFCGFRLYGTYARFDTVSIDDTIRLVKF